MVLTSGIFPGMGPDHLHGHPPTGQPAVRRGRGGTHQTPIPG
jgi:hypothetical protein